jgi:hypothetical protein
MATKPKRQKAVTARATTICNRCREENTQSASWCSKCGSTRSAPAWVHAKRPITCWFGIEVTETNAKYGAVENSVLYVVRPR